MAYEEKATCGCFFGWTCHGPSACGLAKRCAFRHAGGPSLDQKPLPASPMPFFNLRDPQGLPPGLQRPVVAIGNFDGMHVGHRAVAGRARELAARLGVSVALLTFEPHPRRFFRKDEPFFRLMTPRRRAAVAENLGMNGMLTLTFDADLAAMSADDFVTRLLLGRFGVSGVVVGEDFIFGRGRGGSVDTLREAGAALGFSVTAVPPVQIDGAPASSSRVRAAAGEGRSR